MSNYNVKNVRSFKGAEGYGFSCTLYRDKTKIAEVRDEGNGGAIQYQWVSSLERKAFDDYARSLPPVPVDGYDPVRCDPDLAIAAMVDRYEEEAAQRRACRGKTLYRLPSDPEGHWRVIKTTYSDKIEKRLLRHHPEAKILNKQFA